MAKKIIKKPITVKKQDISFIDADELEQVRRAEGSILDKTTNRILSLKTYGYLYGVIINQLCVDLGNDTEDVRIDLLIKLKDFQVNVNSLMKSYIKHDSKSYEASISINRQVEILEEKINKLHNKSKSPFSKCFIKLTLLSFKSILELKLYI